MEKNKKRNKKILRKNRGGNIDTINSNKSESNNENELDYGNIGEKVVLNLKEKFKVEFLIKKITNKFGMGYFDYITCICTPNSNEKICFTVTYDLTNEKIIEEDYYIRCMCCEIEEYIKKKENRINC